MSKSRFLIPALLLVLVSGFALAACGSSESEEDKVTSVIETAATSNDPASCEETQTQSFMEQGSDKEGKEAVEDCEEEAEEEKNAESVEVSEVEVEGEEATATVAVTGSNLDGQSLVLNVVKEEGEWKVNELVEFAKLDRGKLIAAFEGALGEQESIEPEAAECIIEGVEEASDSELEGLFVEGPEGFEEIAAECIEE